MKQSQYPLAKHTTFRIGGEADVFYAPESVPEMLEEIKRLREEKVTCRILGNGSNILVSDNRIRGYVISLKKCANYLELTQDGFVKTGAGTLVAKFILFCIKNNLYGNEHLSSVPATIGGAIFMNAGTWTDKNLFLSDYLVSVEFFDGHKVRSIRKEECEFAYRESIFHRHDDWVILSATFKLPEQSAEEGAKKRKERLQWSKENQDIQYGNAGSIFCVGNGHAFNFVRGIRIGNAGWSRLGGNWINNYGEATYRQVWLLIWLSRIVHFVIGKKTKLEIRIWK